MNHKLAEITQKIYRTYQPMGTPGLALLNSQAEDQFQNILRDETSHLSDNEKQRIHDEIFGWGPIETLKSKEDLFDIIIQGPNHIFYETSQGFTKLNDHFFSSNSFSNFIERLCSSGKVLINQKDPFANTKIDNFRVHMVAPPISKQYQVTLRKHRNQIIPLENLLETGFISSKQIKIIRDLIYNKENFLVIGPTGSGKTTLLNSIIDAFPNNQRAVIIEDTDEIITNNKLHSKLVSREICPPNLNPIFLEDLLKQSLRMRPDRIVIGEVRGKEAKDLMQALATGHSGSMGTLHADNPHQALIRLEMLIQMGAPQWQIEAIRKLIQLSLQTIVTLKADRQNKGIASISKITSLEKFGFLLQEI